MSLYLLSPLTPTHFWVGMFRPLIIIPMAKIIRSEEVVVIENVKLLEDRQLYWTVEVEMSDGSVSLAGCMNDLVNEIEADESLKIKLSRNGKWVLKEGFKINVDW